MKIKVKSNKFDKDMYRASAELCGFFSWFKSIKIGSGFSASKKEAALQAIYHLMEQIYETSDRETIP